LNFFHRKRFYTRKSKFTDSQVMAAVKRVGADTAQMAIKPESIAET